MRLLSVVTALLGLLSGNSTEAADISAALNGTASFLPAPDEGQLPERFRLTKHEFSWNEHPRPKVSDRLTISDITFPSPVVTEFTENNTIHCEYYRPKVAGKVPGVMRNPRIPSLNAVRRRCL